MEILILSLLLFFGLFLAVFGSLNNNSLFTVGGLFVLLLVATSVASSGITFITGSSVTDYGNGTTIIQDITTTQNDWITNGFSRALFLVSVFFLIITVLDELGKDEHNHNNG